MDKVKSIKFYGPFASEYSLAKVNRNLGYALKKLGIDVTFSDDDYFIDRLPKAEDIQKYPWLDKKVNKKIADVAIFNNFPKNPTSEFGLARIPEKIKIAYLAWEESIYPEHFINECNQYLTGVMVISTHVARVLRNSGLRIPVTVVNLGLDHLTDADTSTYKLNTKKKFKFLHISSGHPRKGLDVLLDAYVSEFTKTDDVCLILKLFPNASFDRSMLMKSQSNQNAPEIEVIMSTELSDEEISSLYKQVDALVAPSRAEGFGLPIAEAMLNKVPVIATGYSGQLDFCSENNSWLLTYKLVNSNSSQLIVPGSKWAEPNIDELKMYMRSIYNNENKDDINYRVENAKKQVEKFTWANCATNVNEFVNSITKIHLLKNSKLGVITTRNSICGIAEHSGQLFPGIEKTFNQVVYLANNDESKLILKDELNVVRTWSYGEMGFGATIDEIVKRDLDIIQIEYNTSFYTVDALVDLVKQLHNLKKKVFVSLHSVQGYVDFANYLTILSKAESIIVHSEVDLQYLKKKGYSNVVFHSLGIELPLQYPVIQRKKQLGLDKYSPIIATHGLIHDKKGFLQIIEAAKILKQDYPEMLLLLLTSVNPNNSTSAGVFEQMKIALIKNNLKENTLLISNFLSREEIITLLGTASVIIFAYDQLFESASAAVRTAMSVIRPIITTDTFMFKEIDAVKKVPDNNPQTIASTVKDLLDDKRESAKLVNKIEDYVMKKNWEIVRIETLVNFANFLSQES